MNYSGPVTQYTDEKRYPSAQDEKTQNTKQPHQRKTNLPHIQPTNENPKQPTNPAKAHPNTFTTPDLVQGFELRAARPLNVLNGN